MNKKQEETVLKKGLAPTLTAFKFCTEKNENMHEDISIILELQNQVEIRHHQINWEVCYKFTLTTKRSIISVFLSRSEYYIIASLHS